MPTGVGSHKIPPRARSSIHSGSSPETVEKSGIRYRKLHPTFLVPNTAWNHDGYGERVPRYRRADPVANVLRRQISAMACVEWSHCAAKSRPAVSAARYRAAAPDPSPSTASSFAELPQLSHGSCRVEHERGRCRESCQSQTSTAGASYVSPESRSEQWHGPRYLEGQLDVVCQIRGGPMDSELCL